MAEIQKPAWPRPKLFDWMQQEGNVAEKEMHRTFNCGIGLVIVVAAADAEAAMAELKAQGEAVYNIGVIRARQGDERQTGVVCHRTVGPGVQLRPPAVPSPVDCLGGGQEDNGQAGTSPAGQEGGAQTGICCLAGQRFRAGRNSR